MPLPTVQVFVSSTWLDLRPEREAVRDAVLRMKQTQFVGMEYFGSRDETTRGASLDEVDGSNVYVGIVGARYGSGITEAEYRRARERGLPCFVYFKENSTVAEDARETDPAQAAKLEALKAELGREHIVSTFNNPDDLAARVTADLHRWLFDEYLSNLPPPPVQTLHQLRAPVGDFVGREKEIEELLATLRGGGSAAVSGMGGTGKTELSLYVAERLRDTYPDAQLVLDMRGTAERPREPSDALAACIRAFHGLEQRLPDDLEELTQLYRGTLEGKRALILLDNAFDGAQVRPLLPPTGSALLITSRNAVTLPGMKTRITLDQLSPAEARELLTGIAPRVPSDTADRICELCGYLPLAVRAAGSLLDVTIDLDPSDYATQLGDERTRLEHIGAEGVDLGVEASFNLSYARLAPDTQSVFRQLSVFNASFDATAEEIVCEDEKHSRLTGLLRRGLILYDTETRRYRLHDLARLFADSRMGEDERSAIQIRHAAFYLAVLQECDELYLKGGEAVRDGLAMFDAERRNIEAGRERACERSGANDVAARMCSKYPNTAPDVLMLRQRPRERVLWLEAGLASARLHNDRSTEGALLVNLGNGYQDLGESPRAVEVFEQALNMTRAFGDREAEGTVLGNLGVAYSHLGEPRRAVEFFEQQLAIAREIGARRREADALSNLGNAYGELGEPRRALEFHELHLDITRETGDRRGEGMALSNMGGAYLGLGDMYLAIECFVQRRDIARELGDRDGEGVACYNLAVTFSIMGALSMAVEHAEQALEIFEQTESPRAATVRAQLAKWRAEATEGE